MLDIAGVKVFITKTLANLSYLEKKYDMSKNEKVNVANIYIYIFFKKTTTFCITLKYRTFTQ